MKKWCRTFLLSCLLCLSLCTLAQATDGETLRVGLKYGSDAMSAANLQNYSAFGGYALGYFDADGSFEELGALPQLYEKITVTTDTTYHVQLSGTFYDYDDASRTAAQYSGGFAAYENGAFYARAGSYTSLSAARSAAAQYGGTAVGGSGTGDLMDEIVRDLPPETKNEEEELPRITIVGRPNVGKSSLTNALLGEERNIVTPIAGTTRDAIHSRYNKYGLDFYLVDTAGMRKKGKVTEDLEFYSVMRSIRAIEESDVCILMLDAQQGLESQDLNIHNLIVRNRKGCVIVVNKWDLVEKGNNTMKEWKEALAKKLAPFNDIPIIFTSVLNKQRILEVLQTAIRVYENRKRRVATSALNDYLLPIIENYPPPATKGKYIKIKYVMQLPTPTPQFACFVNLPQYIKDPYRRFLENKIREEWDFSGVPIQIYFRQK